MTEEDQNKIDRANQFINDKGTLQADGNVRISSKDWKEFNDELREKNKQGRDNLSNAFARKNEEMIDKWYTTNNGLTPPPERRNINSKEKIMSEEKSTGEWTPPVDAAEQVAKEEAFINMRHQRKVVLNGLTTQTLSCLPGADGFADTQPAVNLVQGTYYHGINMLDLKDHQKKNGFPTAEYVSDQQLKDAKKDFPDLSPKQGENGISIHWERKNNETGKYEKESVYLFNIAQTTNPEAVKEYAAHKQQEETQKYVDDMKAKYPGWEPKEPKPKELGTIINCSSTQPEIYLGQYFAAVSTGGKFKVTPEQAAEFTKNMETALQKTVVINGKERDDLLVLPKINREANQNCKDLVRLFNINEEKQQYKDQQQQQTQSRGFGR